MYMFSSKDELSKFIASEVVNTTEAIDLLQCSRQDLVDLVQSGKLTPIRSMVKTKIFFKEDVLSYRNKDN